MFSILSGYLEAASVLLAHGAEAGLLRVEGFGFRVEGFGFRIEPPKRTLGSPFGRQSGSYPLETLL